MNVCKMKMMIMIVIMMIIIINNTLIILMKFNFRKQENISYNG